jgi:hypothetical protein
LYHQVKFLSKEKTAALRRLRREGLTRRDRRACTAESGTEA